MGIHGVPWASMPQQLAQFFLMKAPEGSRWAWWGLRLFCKLQEVSGAFVGRQFVSTILVVGGLRQRFHAIFFGMAGQGA